MGADLGIELGYEGKMAIAGIAFAIVAFAGLSVYQTLRQKRQAREKLEELRQAAVGAADAPPGATPFFVARFMGNKPRFFRIYGDIDSLLFLHTGPCYAMFDAEIARGSNRSHWILQAGNVVIAGLAGGAVMAVTAVALLGRAVMRNAGKNPEAAGDIMSIVFGIIAFMAVMFLLLAPGIVWRIVQRGRELSALPLSGLREQSETHPLSFRAMPGNLSEIAIMPLDLDNGHVCAKLTFRHASTGKWKLETTKSQDTLAAIEEFERVFGRAIVDVDYSLRQRLPASLSLNPGKVHA
jgi:hypothetical protein